MALTVRSSRKGILLPIGDADGRLPASTLGAGSRLRFRPKSPEPDELEVLKIPERL